VPTAMTQDDASWDLPLDEEQRALLARVRLLVFDFDGVFTDNKVLVDEDGREAAFCSRGDGLGAVALQSLGFDIVILSTEPNPIVAHRAAKLKIPCVHGLDDKWAALQALLQERGLAAADVAYVGNDINDETCLKNVGLPICTADAHPSVKPLARIVTRRRGGDGAVRQICDAIIGVWRPRG